MELSGRGERETTGYEPFDLMGLNISILNVLVVIGLNISNVLVGTRMF